MFVPRSEDLAWAAGFFDGEGCISTNGKGIVRIQVTQNRIEPLLRFREIVQVGSIQKPRGNGVMDWTVAGKKAKLVLHELWPYLSLPKREQAVRVVRGCK